MFLCTLFVKHFLKLGNFTEWKCDESVCLRTSPHNIPDGFIEAEIFHKGQVVHASVVRQTMTSQTKQYTRKKRFESIFQLENQGISEVVQVGGLGSSNMFTE